MVDDGVAMYVYSFIRLVFQLFYFLSLMLLSLWLYKLNLVMIL